MDINNRDQIFRQAQIKGIAFDIAKAQGGAMMLEIMGRWSETPAPPEIELRQKAANETLQICMALAHAMFNKCML